MRRALAAALPTGLVLAWLLLTIPGGLTPWELVAGAVAATAGATAVGLVVGIGPFARAEAARTELEGASDDDAGPGVVDPRRLPTAMQSLLRAIAVELDAERVVIWRVDREADAVVPVHAFGAHPPTTSAAGSLLAWVAEEGGAVRLDPGPLWSQGPVVAARVDAGRVLTVERAPGADSPEPARVLDVAGLVGPFLALHDRQARVAGEAARVERVSEMLRSLSTQEETDEGSVATGLAAAAVEILDADGALVASWDGEQGEVLAREGRGGGPKPPTRFGALDGDLAHAARVSAVIERGPGNPGPALATDDDRWEGRPPAHRVAIPLVQPDGTVGGVVGAWGRADLSGQGIEFIEALGPLLTLRLVQAGRMARLTTRADKDALTGLWNRAALDEELEKQRARFHRHRRPLGALVIDIDRFKQVNDRHGHEAGDVVLRRVADVVRETVRDADFLARFGGEELVVLMPETLLRPAVEVADRVREAIEAGTIEADGAAIDVTASIGVSACPECVEDPVELFASADRALYAAKEAGRNRVTAAPMRAPAGGAGG